MKTNLTLIQSAFMAAIALALAAFATPAFSQDNIIALGRVNSAGTLLNSANTVNGVVSSSQNGTGGYTVTVTSLGAFTGLVSNDIAIEATVSSTSSGDNTIKGAVSLINDNQLTILIHTDDVEDATNNNAAEARSQHFYFAIYRIPETTPASNASKFVLANGIVNSSGSLAASIGIKGINLTSSKSSSGNYMITLAKAGAFTGDGGNDYVLSLTVEGADDQDQVIRGGVQTTASNDQVVLNVHTDDVQSGGDDNTVTPTDNKFFFTVYRIPTGAVPAKSNTNLLVALARVSSLGFLLSTPSSFDGGTISAIRNSVGDYRVTITSPGAFTGKGTNDYIPQVFLNQGYSSDRAINSSVVVGDDNTLYVDVNTNDLELAGEGQGSPASTGFFLVLMDAVGDFQPDLRIGTRNNLSKMKGNDKYNGNGNGQQITTSLSNLAKKPFFFAMENDGNIVDQVNLREVGAGGKIRTKYFRLSGGRKNVTAKVTSVGLLEDRLTPDHFLRFEASVNYRTLRNRPVKKIRLKAVSQLTGAKKDTNRIQVRPK